MNALEISRYSIVVLFVILFFLPKRYAFFVLLLLSLFDASGPNFASASNVGILNAIKVLGAPMVLTMRLKGNPIRLLKRYRSLPLNAFLLITIYAALALIWSSWKLSGLKMVGYLLGHLVWFLVITYGLVNGYLNRKLLIGVLLIAFVAGFAQSYVLEPSFGIYPFTPQRFTAFLSPQYYSAFLVFMACAIVFGFRKVLLIQDSFILVLVLVVVTMTGSRYSFVSLLFTIMLFFLDKFIRHRSASFMIIWFIVMLVIIGTMLVSFLNFTPFLERTRIKELGYLFTNPEEIKTLKWRIHMYRETISHITASNFFELLFGHGTSSGAEVALAAEPWRGSVTIDANRVIHNEFLRSIYEWGIIGFILLICTFMSLAWIALKGVFQGDYLLFSSFPLLFSGLAIENILASAGGGYGVGLALVLSMAYAKHISKREVRKTRNSLLLSYAEMYKAT